MSKLFIGILAVCGCLWILNSYTPSLWSSGFTVGGFLLRYAYFVIAGVVILAYRLKE